MYPAVEINGINGCVAHLYVLIIGDQPEILISRLKFNFFAAPNTQAVMHHYMQGSNDKNTQVYSLIIFF